MARPAAIRMERFAEAIGVHLATLYRQPPELQPRSVKLRGARLVIETPAQYLARLESMQRSEAPIQQRSMGEV